MNVGGFFIVRSKTDINPHIVSAQQEDGTPRPDLHGKKPTALQQKKYISDEFGIVQNYEIWIKNQSIGKNDPDKRWQQDVLHPKINKGKKRRISNGSLISVGREVPDYLLKFMGEEFNRDLESELILNEMKTESMKKTN